MVNTTAKIRTVYPLFPLRFLCPDNGERYSLFNSGSLKWKVDDWEKIKANL